MIIQFQCPYCEACSPFTFDVNQDCPGCGKPGRHFEIVYEQTTEEKRSTGQWFTTYTDSSFRGCPLLEPFDIPAEDIIPVSPLRRAERLGRELGINRLYLKDETAFATGAYKERPALVSVNHVLRTDRAPILVASSGNMASAFSRFGNMYNVPVIVVVPDVTPDEKIVNSQIYGSRVFKIRGRVDEARPVIDAVARKRGWHTANFSLRPWLVEGGKGMGYELMRQIPDMEYLFFPTGSGLFIRGVYRAYAEMMETGIWEKPFPKMVICQAAGCAPYVKAVRENKTEVEYWDDIRTCAGGLAVKKAPEGDIVLKRVRDTGGTAESVTEEELLDMQKLLANREGIFVEPSGAVGMAVVRKMIEQKMLDPDSKIVAVLTGAGWHDMVSVRKETVPDFSDTEEFEKLVTASMDCV